MMGFGLLSLLVTIGIFFWLTRQETARPDSRPKQEDQLPPQGILDRRYARGELTREEYREIKQDLS